MSKISFEDGYWVCYVCDNRVGEDGLLDHSKTCYTQSEDGGGTSYHEEIDISAIKEE